MTDPAAGMSASEASADFRRPPVMPTWFHAHGQIWVPFSDWDIQALEEGFARCQAALEARAAEREREKAPKDVGGDQSGWFSPALWFSKPSTHAAVLPPPPPPSLPNVRKTPLNQHMLDPDEPEDSRQFRVSVLEDRLLGARAPCRVPLAAAAQEEGRAAAAAAADARAAIGPPLGIHSPSPHPAMYAPPPNAAYPQAYAPPAAMQGSPGVPSAPSTMPYSQPEVPPSHSDATMIPMPAQDDKTLQEENTISTGYPGASYDETLTSDLDSERTASSDASLPSSPAPRRRHRMHYSMPGGRHGGSYASRLTKDQLEELAAQDEWHDLHHAALGADNEVFFQARSPASTLPSSGGRARAHYSRRGAHGSSASASGRPAGSDYRSHARRRSHYASDL
ncbi:hypothetical protein MOBT1_002317 [Malassezia obtusa]|nr:hypothetical protein MOBT1_002317 [Malassezia obtusa]